ncbi:two-component system response regulator NarL [Pseudohalioglobus sediminis]|uniref:Two-component system response regulator NarL n=1 Tax=Pseudohalioglobus sediminis TaxID=2606449 RepID=A0A5B0WZG3_9GAMM|nr:two-component system response regulator NarL [Pseudohalioglobus sediminis]KAA1191795.1 two-component system response regulator NarL [Pseudohalioglobus sediminis]
MVEAVNTILLVDDHPLLRKGVSQLLELEDGLEVIGEAANGNDAVKMAQALDPDLILLDLSMRGMDGIETLSTLRDAGIAAHIVVFTVSDDRADVIAALKSGADGYLLKDSEPELLVDSIHQACSGKMVLSEQLTEILASSFRQDKQQQDLNQLTRRELQILKYIAEGLSNKLIGRRLDIAESTVKVHVKHLLKKLGFRSRVEAAVWMVDQQK